VPKPAILLSPRFRKALKNLNDADFARVEATLQILPDCFGRPHAHTGISIRRLRKNVFECRAGLKLRLLFRQSADTLEFFFIGNHDEIRRIIQDL
jgi:mRNA-degrading endonuclease RelE of RelBE toxin-antitoxin system